VDATGYITPVGGRAGDAKRRPFTGKLFIVLHNEVYIMTMLLSNLSSEGG
jgi:hypothetical protein